MRRRDERSDRASRTRGLTAVLAAVVLAAGSVAACDDPQAYGQANSLILRAPDSLWAQLEDTTYAALERTIRTVREEHQFRVTHVSPDSDDWQDLRRFHQVVIFARPDDPLMGQVLEAAGRAEADPPAVVQAENMWARGQLVTGVLLEPGNEAETWQAQLDEVHSSIDQQYREYVFRRMYVSGVDTMTMDSLRSAHGFTVRVPNVYTVQRFPEERMVIFRNDNPDPSELIRSLTVAWRPRLDTLRPDTAFAWRSRIDTTYYNVPQLLRRDTINLPRRLTHNQQRPALEVQGTWEDQTDFPAAGPFVGRLIQCPERTFFLDAWLYAPGEDKYQYMLQLQRLMDSFRCTRGPGGGG